MSWKGLELKSYVGISFEGPSAARHCTTNAFFWYGADGFASYKEFLVPNCTARGKRRYDSPPTLQEERA